MYPTFVVGGILPVLLLWNAVFATPLDPGSSLGILSQANTTNLNVPSAFKVDIVPNIDISMSPVEIYLAATNMMFDVTDYPLTQTWLDKSFPSPLGSSVIHLTHNAIGKDPSYLTSQHVIWGLNHVLLSMTLSRKYCQTVAYLKWEGQPLGEIKITRQRPRLSTAPKSTNNTALVTLDDPNSSALTHFFDRDVAIEIVYGDKPINEHLIYLTAIKAMGEAAEKGLDTPVPGIITTSIRRVSWKLLREVRPQTPVLKAGHSRMAAYRTLSKMQRDKKFQEIYAMMSIAGVECAIGGFDQGVSGTAASE
ncbi:MAG: hypothetical protein Q9166_007138 [cf. Caloplaca sp. 2 TL-2023]